MSKAEVDTLCEAIKRDILADGPIVLWSGEGRYPGGPLRGLTTANIRSWIAHIDAARARKARGK